MMFTFWRKVKCDYELEVTFTAGCLFVLFCSFVCCCCCCCFLFFVFVFSLIFGVSNFVHHTFKEDNIFCRLHNKSGINICRTIPPVLVYLFGVTTRWSAVVFNPPIVVPLKRYDKVSKTIDVVLVSNILKLMASLILRWCPITDRIMV